MKTKVDVLQLPTGKWVITNKGEIVDRFHVGHAEKWQAELQAMHYRHSGSLASKLKLKKVDGILQGRPFWGVQVAVYKQPSGAWRGNVTIASQEDPIEYRHITYVAHTREAVLKLIAKHGQDVLQTINILNPSAGRIDISRSEYGGCTDPGTETYHCM